MRQLLTWYGITDIRSAMGFEDQGPILGALKTGNFDEIHILAYTKKRKFTPEEISMQRNAVVDLNNFQCDKSFISKEDSWKFVDILANTPTGHQFYVDWLKKQLVKLCINVNIILHDSFLTELNDTEEIYFSAIKALTTATAKQNNEITFFLSPGTPVMAFSWALAMLAFPSVNIKLLASSDFRKGINTILIPNTILQHIENGRKKWDIENAK